MGAASLKRGDRVTVTLDAEVLRVVDIEPGSEEIELRVQNERGGSTYLYTHPDKVEKVEPPVEVFGPGDVVRDKREGSLWALARGGYLRLGGSGYVSVRSDIPFTSENYERVDLS